LGGPSDVPTDQVNLNSFGQQQQQQPQQPQRVMAGEPSESATAAHQPVAGAGHQGGGQQQGGFPNPLSEKLDAPRVDDQDDFGVKSWDEIAAEAQTGGHDPVKGPSDFERIQAAQKKAAKQSKGTNPALIGVLVVALAGMGYLFFWPEEKATIGGVEPTGPQCTRVICYPEKEKPTCAGNADCKEQAIKSYKVAAELYEKKGANITNLYEAYKQLDKVDLFLGIGGIQTPPEQIKDYQQRMKKYEEELEKKARDYRIKIHQLEQRRMFEQKATKLNEWMAFYTDKHNKWYKEAIAQERKMKDRGTWPK
jgi:hypothetical protein